jgi:hypothetical protein
VVLRVVVEIHPAAQDEEAVDALEVVGNGDGEVGRQSRASPPCGESVCDEGGVDRPLLFDDEAAGPADVVRTTERGYSGPRRDIVGRCPVANRPG